MRILSVEWGRGVARIHQNLIGSVTHFLLPDLPGVNLASDQYFDLPQESCKRMRTIAVGKHDTVSFERALQDLEKDNNLESILLVGGNEKGPESLSTYEAIARTKSTCSTKRVWCVADPNDPESVSKVERKVSAGANGIISQPLLTSHALAVLESYPLSSCKVVAGVAMPKNLRQLEFWYQLIEPSSVNRKKDELVLASLDHFSSNQSPMDWIKSTQLNTLPSSVIGLHMMPLTNTAMLLDLLQDPMVVDKYETL